MVPKTVDTVLTQLKKDGMNFQNYRLSGNPYQAVLVLRFTCQKVHFPWIGSDQSEIMGNVETNTMTSDTSTRSETLDTSYMGIPEYYSPRENEKGPVPCHDSGVDLTSADPHEDRDRKDRRLNSLSPESKLKELFDPSRHMSNYMGSDSRGIEVDVQTDLDMEYMKRLMDEFNAREYLPSREPYSHLRMKKTSVDTSFTDSLENELEAVKGRHFLQSDQECQTDQEGTEGSITERLKSSEDDLFWNEFSSSSLVDKGVQTLKCVPDTDNNDFVADARRTEGLLDTISKAIQTVGYLEDFIQKTPDNKTIHPKLQDTRSVSCQTEGRGRRQRRHQMRFSNTPIESLSVDSEDLRIVLPPEYYEDSEDEEAHPHRPKPILKNSSCQTDKQHTIMQKTQECQAYPSELGILCNQSCQTRPQRPPRQTSQHSQTVVQPPIIQLNKLCQTEVVSTEITSPRSVSPVEVSQNYFHAFQTIDDYSHMNSCSVLTEAGTSPLSLEMTDVGTSTLSLGVQSIGTDPHVSLGEILDDEMKGLTMERSCQTEEMSEQAEISIPQFNFFEQVLSSSPPQQDPLKPPTHHFKDAETQTVKCTMITRGVGIRVKHKDSENQTEDQVGLPPLFIQPPSKSSHLAAVKREPLKIYKALPDTLKGGTSKLHRSATLDGTHKKKKKKRSKASAQALKKSSVFEALIQPSTSTAPQPTVQTVTRVYNEEDFKQYVDLLPARHEPIIVLQSGTPLGVIQGALKLRSGGHDLWVEALYLCVLQEVVIPLYCSGGSHKRCMPGQLIDLQHVDWHKDFALFKAKGSFESVNPGMPEFEAAERCCQVTMGATPTSSITLKKDGKGSKRNSCASQ